jgi:hypothetical protein
LFVKLVVGKRRLSGGVVRRGASDGAAALSPVLLQEAAEH